MARVDRGLKWNYFGGYEKKRSRDIGEPNVKDPDPRLLKKNWSPAELDKLNRRASFFKVPFNKKDEFRKEFPWARWDAKSKTWSIYPAPKPADLAKLKKMGIQRAPNPYAVASEEDQWDSPF